MCCTLIMYKQVQKTGFATFRYLSKTLQINTCKYMLTNKVNMGPKILSLIMVYKPILNKLLLSRQPK